MCCRRQRASPPLRGWRWARRCSWLPEAGVAAGRAAAGVERRVPGAQRRHPADGGAVRRPPQGDPRRGRSARGRQGRAPPRAHAGAARVRKSWRPVRDDPPGEAGLLAAAHAEFKRGSGRTPRATAKRSSCCARARTNCGRTDSPSYESSGTRASCAHSGGAGRGGLQRPRRAARARGSSMDDGVDTTEERLRLADALDTGARHASLMAGGGGGGGVRLGGRMVWCGRRR